MNNIMEENLKNMYDAYSKILEKKDQKISDLEAKLAESEKRVKGLAEELENMSSHYSFVRNKLAESYSQEDVDELKQQLAEREKALEAKESVNQMYKATLSLKDSDFSDLVRENAKLKQQLAESENENKQLIKALNGETFINYKLPMENAKLKQQLAEKEKEVDKLKYELEWAKQDLNECAVGLEQKYNQDKISFTVECLERVKRPFEHHLNNKLFSVEYRQHIRSFFNEIDNQIKQLREKK